MPIIRRRLWWPLAALAVISAVQSTSWATQHSRSEAAQVCSVTEWMRGVPQGCRLVSFDILDRNPRRLAPKARVDIALTYVTSAGRYETTVLMKDIDLLATGPLAIAQGDRPMLRVTAALTPQQARRLQLAATCGTIGMREATGSSARGKESVSAWEIQAIEDRTEAVEADLVISTADAISLKRPTLAVSSGGSSEGARSVIAVPVEVELQR